MIQEHYLISDSEIVPWVPQLKSLTQEAILWIESRLQCPDLDLVVYRYESFVLPETGIGGFSATEHLSFIAVDPKNENFAGCFEKEFPACIAHEVHHSARRASVGYGKTLAEALVSEGLALHFEEEFRCEKPSYLPTYEAQVLNKKLQELESELGNEEYDHASLFFGDEALGTKYLGYVLGYEIVSKYLARVQSDAGAKVDEGASSFF